MPKISENNFVKLIRRQNEHNPAVYDVASKESIFGKVRLDTPDDWNAYFIQDRGFVHKQARSCEKC